ncbi:hypothetical protein ABIE00_003844 [Arthrobacter sp. OAP107]
MTAEAFQLYEICCPCETSRTKIIPTDDAGPRTQSANVQLSPAPKARTYCYAPKPASAVVLPAP